MLGPVEEGRLRLDAATWGTMGVGIGCAVAAAVTRPDRLVVAVEGDSAFGFSGMECETIARRAPAVCCMLNSCWPEQAGVPEQLEKQCAAHLHCCCSKQAAAWCKTLVY